MKYAVALLLAFLSDFAVEACECHIDNRPDIKKALKTSAVIFSGLVVSEEQIEILHSYDKGIVIGNKALGKNKVYSTGAIVKYCFRIDSAFKGSKDDTIFVYTYLLSGMCGFKFETGKNYIVYAFKEKYYDKKRKKKHFLFTTTCERTVEYSSGEEQIIKNSL